MPKNIVLIGFMATGKSLLSRMLSRELACEVVSTDDLIEKAEGLSIPDIFKKHGEAYFREAECRAVQAAAEHEGMIIDCGGGVVLNQQNVEHLKRTGRIFCLVSSPETIEQRIRLLGGRPLLDVPDPAAEIARLLSEREIFYRQAADVIVDTNGDDYSRMMQDILKHHQ